MKVQESAHHPLSDKLKASPVLCDIHGDFSSFPQARGRGIFHREEERLRAKRQLFVILQFCNVVFLQVLCLFSIAKST